MPLFKDTALSGTGSGGSSVIDGEVGTHAELPDVSTSTGQIWIVRTTTGVIGINRKQAGMYYSDGATWSRLDVNYDAEKTYYNNALSIFTSTNVKGALDEVSTEIVEDRKIRHGVVGTHPVELVTKNVDPTKYDVAGFDYYINGTKYTYPGATGLTPSWGAGDNFQIIGVDASGLHTLLAKDSFYQPSDLDNILEIGGFTTNDAVNINNTGNSYFEGDKLHQNLYAWSKFAKKTNFLGTAGSISENVIPLRLDIAGGDIINPNLERAEITAETTIGAEAYFHVAGVWTLQPLTSPFIVNNSQYTNGTDLVNASNNKFLSHTIARSSRTNAIYFIYSEAQYDNEAEAIDAPASLGGFGSELGNEVEPLAKLIIKKDATSINQIIDVRNQTTTTISASTSTLQTTYDRSAVPQIVLANAKPLEIRNDVGDTNTKLQVWGTNDGTEILSVTPTGLSTQGVANGLAELDGTTLVPKTQLGTGTADATKFLRGDGIWATPSGAGGGLAAIPFYRADGSRDDITLEALVDLLTLTITNQLDLGNNADILVGSAYGWSDLKAPVRPGSGQNDPTLTAFIGNLKLPAFAGNIMKEFQAEFHINHDYAPSTNLYPHIHYSVNTTSTGVVRWGFEYTLAAGHQQAGTVSVFEPPTVTVYVEQSIDGTQYKHYIAEVADVDAINSVKIEPDAVVLVRIFRDASHANDTFPDSVFGITVDLHQQVGRFSTKNKTPDFYT